jgi:hypothetical protein
MMVIPRVERDFGGGLVSINGFGFIGMMLLRDTITINVNIDNKDKDKNDPTTTTGVVQGLMEKHGGPMAVLNAVTYPR